MPTATLNAAKCESPTPAASSMHSMKLRDGVEIVYRAWMPPAGSADRAVLLFHRGHEHSGRYEDLVETLALQDTAVFAWDQRRHGRSPGARGSAESFSALVKDVDEFVQHVSRHYHIGVDRMVVMGHSVGAVLVAAWVHDYAPPIRGQILVTPAFRVRLYVPLAMPMLRLLRRIRPQSFVKSYVRSRMLTHDPQQQASYDRDPLISRQIAVSVLIDLHDAATRLMDDAAAICTPTLILSASRDLVVSAAAQESFFQRLGATTKRLVQYDGFHHAILHESERHKPIGAMRSFIEDRMKEVPGSDARELSEPAVSRSSVSGPSKVSFAIARGFLKTIGRLSHGVRIGWKRGFESGESLDHVYRNTPRGFGPIGRCIDRVYLNSAGWRGIRERKVILERLLDQAISDLHAHGREVRILDIAAGPGRYVLDTIRRRAPIPMTALLRDRDEHGLNAGRELARQLGLAGVAYETGDAFDETELAAIRPRPSIVIVSGLYELFSDNSLIERSLRGLRQAIDERGYLIYTNQPWHPQLAFIANVLINRDHEPWVMRCRPQTEIDLLVRRAGFEKSITEIDQQGIFTVSLARPATHQAE